MSLSLFSHLNKTSVPFINVSVKSDLENDSLQAIFIEVLQE